MPITNEAAVEILREDLAAEERSAAHYRKHAKFPGDALAAEEHERHAEALRAAIAALSPWQPIESAPSDVSVIVSAGGVVGEARFFVDYEGWWWAGSHPTDCYDGRVDGYPTHWQPLPQPANPEEQQP